MKEIIHQLTNSTRIIVSSRTIRNVEMLSIRRQRNYGDYWTLDSDYDEQASIIMSATELAGFIEKISKLLPLL